MWNCNHGKMCQWAWPLTPLELRSTFSAADAPHRRLCVTCATLPPTGRILSRLSAQNTVARRREGRQSVVIYSQYNKYWPTNPQQTHYWCISPVEFPGDFEQVDSHTLYKHMESFKLNNKNKTKHCRGTRKYAWPWCSSCKAILASLKTWLNVCFF